MTPNCVDRFFALDVVPGSYGMGSVDLSTITAPTTYVFFPNHDHYEKPQDLLPVEASAVVWVVLIDSTVDVDIPQNPASCTTYCDKYR